MNGSQIGVVLVTAIIAAVGAAFVTSAIAGDTVAPPPPAAAVDASVADDLQQRLTELTDRLEALSTRVDVAQRDAGAPTAPRIDPAALEALADRITALEGRFAEGAPSVGGAAAPDASLQAFNDRLSKLESRMQERQQQRGQRRGGSRGSMTDQLAERLKLDDTQKQQVQVILQEQMAKGRELMRKGMEAMRNGEEFDWRAEMQGVREETEGAIRQTLNADQQKEFEKMVEEGALNPMRGFRGRGGFGGGNRGGGEGGNGRGF